MSGIKLFYLLAILSTTAGKECQIPDEELTRIGDVLTHIDKPIYEEEKEFENDHDECAQLLNNVHIHLRRLTQRYKLMNKGYVKVEEFKRMTKEYERQLEELRKELNQFEKQAQDSAKNRLGVLKENIKTLEENVTKLHKDLKRVSDEYAKVQMNLCITYLKANKINNAKSRAGQVSSKYLIELIQKFLTVEKGSALAVIDFCLAIPDLDDRGEAYKTIYSILESRDWYDEDEYLVLEAEVQKMNASLVAGSKITEERRNEIYDLLQNMSLPSGFFFNEWTGDLNHSINLVEIKNSVDNLYLTQMQRLGEKIASSNHYNSVRNLLKLLAMSNNHFKIAAYRVLIEKKIGYALGMIWFDMISMNYDDWAHDHHVSKQFNETYELLPNSLKKLRSCTKNFNIYHIKSGKPNECIVTTKKSIDIKHPTLHTTLGHAMRVTTSTNNCTRFRLESSGDKASVKIVSEDGSALTNINIAVPGNVWFSQVGAPYNNGYNAKLASSQEWILEANYLNETIKIESEFNEYQTGKSVDHLLINRTESGSSLVVGRYGYSGLKMKGVERLVEWEFTCVDK